MAFGWSISDIALLVRLAYKTTQGARAACGQYDDLTRDTSNLHVVLNRLHSEAAKAESPLSSGIGAGSYAYELESIATGCDQVLTRFDSILVKYNALSEQERSFRKLWKKVRFGNGAIVDVVELKSEVTYYTAALSLFLNLVSVGAIGEVGIKMDQAGSDLKDIKAAVNHITARLLAKETKEGSVLTAYTDDDTGVWRELRRGLVEEGFRSSIIRKHTAMIMAYVKELGDNGVLDHINTDEPVFPLPDLPVDEQDTESSPTERSQHLVGQTDEPDGISGDNGLLNESEQRERDPESSLPSTFHENGKSLENKRVQMMKVVSTVDIRQGKLSRRNGHQSEKLQSKSSDDDLSAVVNEGSRSSKHKYTTRWRRSVPKYNQDSIDHERDSGEDVGELEMVGSIPVDDPENKTQNTFYDLKELYRTDRAEVQKLPGVGDHGQREPIKLTFSRDPLSEDDTAQMASM
ncbi:MAG: hypothetical protein Q9169_003994 [Polycauliona sp. 2 TL-2023]